MYQGNEYDFASVMPEAIASGVFSSLCTIQEPTGELTGSGAPDLTSGPNANGYVDVAGLVDIPCMNAPQSPMRIIATETKSSSEIEKYNENHVLLSDYYPQIESQTNWRAVIDGVAYDINGAESDSQKQMTRLKVELASV